MFKPALAAILAAVALPALSATVSASFVRSTPWTSGMAVDAVTGQAHVLDGYYGLQTVTTYADAAALEAGAAASSVSTADRLWGPYIAAHDGMLFGRTSGVVDSYGWPVDARTSRIDAASGSTLQTIAVAGMGGDNGTHTFDWGGFSGVNAMSDGRHLYVLGGAASGGQWLLQRYDFALNLLSSLSFAPASASSCYGAPNPGFAFVIAGQVFLGDDYCGGQVSMRVDANAGTVSSVDITIAGLVGSPYVSNASYDALGDTLYLNSSGGLYKVAGAASAFGVDLAVSNDVPEPSGLALAGLALALAAVQRRRARGCAASQTFARC